MASREGEAGELSEMKEERMAARRRRVEEQLETKRREARGEHPLKEKEEEVDPEKERKSRYQIDLSEQRLEKLLSDGTQLVTNVAVAGHSKEVLRRQEEEDSRRARYEKLEAEVVAGSERFEEIMGKWSKGKGKKVPQEMQTLLQEQKTACDAMVDEKDRLIGEFQMELKSKDEQYVRHLKIQAEDIDLLLERMEEQTRSLMKTYREELGEIERAFEAERKELLEEQKSEWEKTMTGRREKEKEYLEERERRLEENEAQLHHLWVRNMEEFNRIKIKLETDIQVLQQQLQQMKATFQLNAEKLEYNFQVLKKRDEENTVTISQQKRRLTRLQDTLNTLRSKLAKQEKTQQSELTALMEEFRKNTEQYRELQKKVKHFRLSDTRRFHDIWQMNEERVRVLADEVLCADEVIHRQQLGLGWERPRLPESVMARTVTQPTNTSLSQATIYASQVLSDVASEREDSATASAEPSYPPSLVKQVLKMLCEEAEFLIESKLSHLLAPLEEEEQVLMRLDAIFSALHIETEEDIHKLVKYFMREVKKEEEEKEEEEKEEEEEEKEEEEEEKEEENATTQSIAKDEVKVTLIHPNEVPQVLKSFVEQRQQTGQSSSLLSHSLASKVGHEEALDGTFWKQMAAVPHESHERVWTALRDGLEQYHGILTARAKLIEQTGGLRKQNLELRLLLHQYMQARINRELEIPPTVVLPIASQQPAV